MRWLKNVALLLPFVALAACQAVATGSQTSAAPTPTDSAAHESTQPAEKRVMADDLPSLGPAPDFTNEVWLNSAGPLTLEALRGRVVLVEFWTFG